MIKRRQLCETLTSETNVVMEGVNLVFKPGNIYLVLGAPGSGKSTLLKMITGKLQEENDHVAGGTIAINTFTTHSTNVE
jgi:ABC-type multidrug transport system ATPase subunit